MKFLPIGIVAVVGFWLLFVLLNRFAEPDHGLVMLCSIRPGCSGKDVKARALVTLSIALDRG